MESERRVRARSCRIVEAALASLWIGSAVEALAFRQHAAVLLAVSAALGTVATVILGRDQRAAAGFTVVFAATAWASSTGAVPQHWPWDKLEHLMISALLTLWIAGRAAAFASSRTASRWLHARIVAAGGVALAAGAVWEVVEWSSDHVFATHFSPTTGDAVTDLIADALGIAVAVAILSARQAFSRGPASRSRGAMSPQRRAP